MSGLEDELETAFETAGYEVGDVSRNRDQYRVALFEEGAQADELRSVTYDVVDEDDVLALNVSAESVEGQDAMGTVVSFRHRPG
jgi:hypothetical protein